MNTKIIKTIIKNIKRAKKTIKIRKKICFIFEINYYILEAAPKNKTKAR